MELVKDTRDRIFAAADSLYDQAGRATFPTVDAVRKTARVNMNDASVGMKEWRRAQTAQAAPVAAQVPEVVQQASGVALVALWAAAQELANESLRAAQAGWDTERIEAETLNKQMADAYESQEAELKTAQGLIAELQEAGRQAAELAEENRRQFEDTRNALLGMQQRAAVAERLATELRVELDHAHQEAAKGRAEMLEVRQTHGREVEALRTEMTASRAKADAVLEATNAENMKLADKLSNAQALAHEAQSELAKAVAEVEVVQEQRKSAAQEAEQMAERFTKAQAERDQAQKEAGKAREDAATLRGQRDAAKEQNTHLLQTLKIHAEKQPPKSKGQ